LKITTRYIYAQWQLETISISQKRSGQASRRIRYLVEDHELTIMAVQIMGRVGSRSINFSEDGLGSSVQKAGQLIHPTIKCVTGCGKVEAG
jgi:hypothetical protein